MGGWPDRLSKTDGLAVWRRTRDASGANRLPLPAARIGTIARVHVNESNREWSLNKRCRTLQRVSQNAMADYVGGNWRDCNGSGVGLGTPRSGGAAGLVRTHDAAGVFADD